MTTTENRTLPNAKAFSEVVRAHHLTEPASLDSTLRLFGFLTAWPALYFLAHWAHNPFVWALVWITQALLFQSYNVGLHESVHNNLCKNRTLNYLAGHAFAFPILYNYAAYRSSHLQHHKNTNVSGLDPEPAHFERNIFDYLGYLFLSGVMYTFILIGEGIQTTLGNGRPWTLARSRRRLTALSTLLTLSELALLTTGLIQAPRLVIELWLVPFLISNICFTSTVTHAEHTDCAPGPDSAFLTTRTTYSNPIFRFFIWNVNLHTAHHLVPSIPGQKLTRLQPYLDPFCQHTSRSYLAWHRAFLRRLPRHRPQTPSQMP